MKVFLLFFSLFICFTFHAEIADSNRFKFRNFELSFGQSLLFISNSKQTNIINNEAIVIPTSAILFSAEFRPDKYIRVPVFLNIATESKQFLVNGQLVNEKASPTLGAGLFFKTFQIKIDDKSELEFEVGPLASFLIDTKNSVRVAPILAGRFKILRGENFVMYIGTSYSFGINALGLLYGTGTSF
jgi:hypothetical protein